MHSIALTCRALYQIFQSAAIQYICELDLGFMEDAGSGRPPAELLETLRDRRKAWGELNWKSVEIVKVDTVLSAYELVAGAFAQTDGSIFSVFWLPSATREGSYSATSLGFSIRDFIIDVAQDLVIFFHEEELPSGSRRASLHCRTISTNETHPACSSVDDMYFEVHQHPDYGNIILYLELEVAADVLFVSVRQEPAAALRVLIWNWKMGLRSLYVVRRDVFILTSTADSGKILVYQINPTGTSIPVLIATLFLPPTRGHRHALTIRAHSGQFQERPTPGALFMPSPTLRTHVFSFSYSFYPGRNKSYTMFVGSSTFLRYIDSGCEALEVPWREWGEQESRFMEKRIEGHWLRYAHGNRIVCKSFNKRGIDVLDFTPSPSFKPTRSASGSQVQQYFSRDDPTVISKEASTFKGDVVTRLPYRTASREVAKTPFAYMIDEERIIGLELGTAAVELTVYSF
ncbi:hypothetical protein NLJ89_g3927 [Agrocybe chaxingu]|uniref:Uncharacterized protein n=1 Tax=Agrocybe chaxingu TaxID=84603 RepID=A0A9W8K9B6_9AGAR|nr:hypothetical protein NLJ89_g3927 [Agrocybe chaxingu]